MSMVVRLIFLVWSSCLGDIFHDFLLIKRDHWERLCVSEAVRFKCFFPLEPKPFPGLIVGTAETGRGS